jgi:hypothetical protein
MYIHDEPARGRHKVTVVKWADLFPPKPEVVTVTPRAPKLAKPMEWVRVNE